MTFVFPLPPNLANARMHWRVKDRERKSYYAKLDVMQMWKDFPAPPRTPLNRASIRATLFCWNKGDTGNVMNRMKWIEDWLVTRGYLVDDSEKHLKWEGFPTQQIDRKRSEVEIVVTPLSVE